MVVGGCFCGKVRVNYTGEFMKPGLCHCLDCRKLTSSPYSYIFLVETANLAVSGHPRELTKAPDSGNDVRNYFCPDCGTPLYGRKVKPNGDPNEVTVLRAGILDDIDALNERKPEVEIYTDRRLSWIGPVEGAEQYDEMLPLP